MRIRGRSTRSNRTSDRQEIGRMPNYDSRQPINRPPTSFRSLSGSAPIYSYDSTSRKAKNTDAQEESE